MKRALVLVTNGTEELEAVAAIDILRRAGVHVTVGGLESDQPVTCSRQVILVPDFSLASLDTNFDALVLPGGLEGAKAFSNSNKVTTLLQEFYESNKIVAAICAAPIALLSSEIGKGKKLTSHPSVKSQLDEYYDYQDARVVIDGNLVTSRGPGTAVEFALELVGLLCGNEIKNQVAKPMLV